MTKVTMATRKRRLNLRALIILGVVIVAALPILYGLKALQERRGAAALLAEAQRAVANHQPLHALGFLNRYLTYHRDDLTALDLKAKLLADAARDSGQAMEAIQVHTRILGLVDQLEKQGKAKTSDWVETRRRLVRLSVDFPMFDQVIAVEAQAILLVEELNAAKKLDADAYNLLARAYEETANYYDDQKKKKGALDEAREAYKEAENLEPGNVTGAAGLAQLYLDRLKEVDGAAEVINQVVANTAPDVKGHDPKKHASALLLRAKFNIRQATPSLRVGNEITPREREALLKTARADLDEAFRLDPDSVDIRLAEADLALQIPPIDTTVARRFIDTMPAAQRNNRNVRILEARIDLAEKHPAAAIQAYRAALLQSGGSDAEITWYLVGLLLDLGRVDQSTNELIEQYERLSRLALPAVSQVGVAKVEAAVRELDARCAYLKGLYDLENKRPADALVKLEPLRKQPLRDINQQYLYYLGRAYSETGNTEKAREAFLQATEAARAWPPPWLALARLDEAKRPDEAVATLRRGLAQAPNDPMLLAELAELLYRREMAKANPQQRSWSEIEDLLKRTEQGSTVPSADILIVRAKYLSARGQFQDAVALLETATKSQPQSVDLWTTRVNVEISRGRFSKALELLDEATKAAGPQAVFVRARAMVLIQKGEVTEAVAALNEGLTHLPEEQRSELWKALGTLHQTRRDFPAARAAFEAWAKLEPANPEPLLALFDLALAEGNDATIEAAVERVRDVDGDKGYLWRSARAQSLLRPHGGAPPTAAQLDEAAGLAQEIRQADPKLSFILEGQICEKRSQTDDAIKAYTKAADLNGGDAALIPLLTLLRRENRTDAIKQVQAKHNITDSALNRLAAMQALQAGDKGQAEQLAALAVQGDPQGFDIRTWQAQVLRALGKPKEAEAALRKLTTEKPAEPLAWFQLLMIQASQGNTADAAATLEAMRARLKPEAFAGQNPDLFWAQCYRVVGKLDQAVDSCREALRKQPGSAAVFQAVITLFDQTGLPRLQAEAVDMLQAVFDRDKENGWARRQLAERLAGRPNDRASWERALAIIGPEPLPDDQAADKFTRARVYAQSPLEGDRQKAITILQKLSVDLPNDNGVHDQLGRLLLADHRPAEAREHLAKAAENSRASFDTIVSYAGILLALNDADGTAKQIARLEQIDPNSRSVLDLKVKLLTLQGKPADAAALLEKAFADQAEAADILTFGETIALMLRDLGQPQTAERVARKLAAKGPYGRCTLAKILAIQGRLDEAAALLEEAGKTDPATAGTAALSMTLMPKPDPRWTVLADRLLADALKTVTASSDPKEKLALFALLDKQSMVRHIQKRYSDEVAIYQQMFALKPSNMAFLNNLAWTLSEEMNNPQEGLKWADEAIKALGPQPALLDTRGVILTRLGKYDEAVRVLDSAVRATPSGAFLYHLARAYRKMNRTDDARSCRDRARAAGLTREQLQPSEQADWDAVMNP